LTKDEEDVPNQVPRLRKKFLLKENYQAQKLEEAQAG
jgi:hypothetical protein